VSFLRRPITALLAIITLVIGVTACSSDTSAAQHKLTIAFVVDPSWSHIPVAEKAGYFKAHGLDVKVVNFSTGVEALQALTAGQVDIATAAAVPTSAAIPKSPSLRVVADGSRWNGSRIVARKNAAISSLADLNGKKIGTPLGTSAAYFASTVLKQAGVNAELVQVAPSAMVTAATQANVDAVSIFQPYQTQVIQALGNDAVVLKDDSPDVFIDHCLYLSTESVTSEKAADLSSFFAALNDASKDLATQANNSVQAVPAATHLDADLTAKVLTEYDFSLQLNPSLADTLGTLGQWAKDTGKMDAGAKLPDYQQFLVNKFVAQ
jgi:NitT/TauT family transport system substrate-binding protein